VDLHGLVGGLDREAPALELGLGGGQGEVGALVLEIGGLVDEQPGGLDLGRHVRELALDRLELRDRPTERASLLGVGERLVERSLGQTHAHRGDTDPADVEHVQELAKPASARAEQILRRHATVREGERARIRGIPAHLPVGLSRLVAGGAVGDDQVRDLTLVCRALAAAAVLSATRAGHRGDHHHARYIRAGVGDELLGAVDDPLAILERRASARVAGVRAGFGLGQPEGAESLAAAQSRHPLLLLLLGPEQVDRLGSERGVGAERDRHRGVHARQLLDRERVGERVAPGAAVLLGKRDPHQVELAQAADDLVGEGVGAVELLCDRADLLLGELTDGPLQQAVLVG
jgi:hypothetical protein